MKKLVLILAAFALLPATAAADDLSAELSGPCQGLVSLVTSGSTISYGILSNHPSPTQATVTGGGVNINLQANFGGTGSATGTVSASGADIAALNANPGNFTVTVASPNCTGQLVTNGGSTGGGNSVIEFSAGNYSIVDNGGDITIEVNRTGDTSGEVMVDYATSDGTATAPGDYTAASGTLTWADGDASAQSFTVSVNDGNSNGVETVNLTLSNPTGDAELGLSAATLTIVDDQSLICVEGPNTLCLGADDRFRATIAYDTGTGTGMGETFPIDSRDSGLFFFFGAENIEMLLKVLDACELPGFNAFWVFYAATTDVGFTLTITDTQTGTVRTYSNNLGTPAAPVLDTAAFDTCM